MPAPALLAPLFAGIGALVSSSFAQAAARLIAKYGFIVATVATWITMFVGILAASIAAVKALAPVAPPYLAFALGLLPPITPYIYSAYISILISKRLYDYYVQRTKQLFHA